MTRTTRFAALLGLSLMAFCPAPGAHADPLKIMGAGYVETSEKVVFKARSHSEHILEKVSRHHAHRVRLELARDTVEPHHSSGPLLTAAMRDLGRGKFTPKPGPWCRDSINQWAREAGIHLRNTSRRAIDALGLGPHVRDPRPGDLVVMRHHVTIFAGWGGRGVLGLGGNQGHRVKVSSYPRRSILAFVRV